MLAGLVLLLGCDYLRICDGRNRRGGRSRGLLEVRWQPGGLSAPDRRERAEHQGTPRSGAPEGFSTTWRQSPDGKGRSKEQADGSSEDETTLDMLVKLRCTLSRNP